MKTFGAATLAAAISLLITAAVHAKIIDCKVVSVKKDTDTVILDCGSKAAELKAGAKIKIRSTSVRRVPLMGC